jgi:hypothetical protein
VFVGVAKELGRSTIPAISKEVLLGNRELTFARDNADLDTWWQSCVEKKGWKLEEV